MRAVAPGLCALALAAACVDTLVGRNPADTPAGVFDVVWKDFDRNYSFFEVKHVDWHAAYQRYAPRRARRKQSTRSLRTSARCSQSSTIRASI